MNENVSVQKYKIKPCRHMEKWVSALADDSLTGFARWYTQMHVSGCEHCHATLEALKQVRERLQAFRAIGDATFPASLSEDRRQLLYAALNEIDRRRL